MTTLDEIQARADAATEGPWEAHLGHGAWMIQDDSCDDIATVHDRMGIDDDPQAEANATFIINARSDVPALIKALRAVEALHKEMPRTTMIGPYCTHCISSIDGGPELWPCKTLRAIQQALGG